MRKAKTKRRQSKIPIDQSPRVPKVKKAFSRKVIKRKYREIKGLAKLTMAILQKQDKAQKLIDQAKELLMEAGVLQGEFNRKTWKADHIMNM